MGLARLTKATELCKKINWGSLQAKVSSLNTSKPQELIKFKEGLQDGKSIFSPELFEFARPHRMRMKNGEIVEDGLALCRMSDVLPNHGILETVKEGAANLNGLYTRNSLHFSLNHAVYSHSYGNWNEQKYLFILPFDKVENIVGGSAVDIFTKGSVRLPHGSVIVRQNKHLKNGVYRIINAEDIQEFRECQGVRIIETSEKPHDISGQILYKLGYQEQKGGGLSWNDKIDSHFVDFMKGKGMVIGAHTHTPNGSIEIMLHFLAISSNLKYPWQLTKSINLKKIILKVIEDMEKLSKEQNLPLNHNTKVLKEIIKTSKTPQLAIDQIQKRLKINGFMYPLNKEMTDALAMLTKTQLARECKQFGRILDFKNSKAVLDRCSGRRKGFLA